MGQSLHRVHQFNYGYFNHSRDTVFTFSRGNRWDHRVPIPITEQKCLAGAKVFFLKKIKKIKIEDSRISVNIWEKYLKGSSVPVYSFSQPCSYIRNTSIVSCFPLALLLQQTLRFCGHQAPTALNGYISSGASTKHGQPNWLILLLVSLIWLASLLAVQLYWY